MLPFMVENIWLRMKNFRQNKLLKEILEELFAIRILLPLGGMLYKCFPNYFFLPIHGIKKGKE